MLGAIKRAAFAGALVANLVIGTLAAPPAFAADTTSLTFNPSSQNVTAGATFNVDVDINTLANTLGAQFAVTYDSTKLTLSSVTWGTFFTSYQSNPTNGCGSSFTEPFTPVASPGLSKTGGYALIGCSGTGPTGTGQLATLSFSALSGVTGTTTIGLTNVTINGVSNADLTVNSGSVTILPVLADLGVTKLTVTELNGNPSQFTVSYKVINTGAGSAPASITSVAATCTVPAHVTINTPLIAAGGNSGTETSPTFTFKSGCTTSTVTVTADSTNVVPESDTDVDGARTTYTMP
jgi:hypothetical protein